MSEGDDKMKKTVLILMLAVMCLCGCGRGVVLDENEKIDGNGTSEVVKQGEKYTNDGTTVYKNGEAFCEPKEMKDNRLFALGEYLYVNTHKGAMQIDIKSAKIRKFGNGEIVAAGGKFIYYQSSDNKVGNMILYKINMTDGAQLQLFQDTIVDVKILGDDVFWFKGESGNEYVNALDSDEGMFYKDRTGENETE